MTLGVHQHISNTRGSLFATPQEDEEPPNTALKQLSNALAPFSLNLQLTTEEMAFLASGISQTSLTSNISLFDLFFFDLHTKLLALDQKIQRDTLEKIIETLEICYITLVPKGTKDTTSLAEFLNSLIPTLWSANATFSQEPAQKTLPLAIEDLSKYVEVLKKFIAHPSCHDLLFHQPLIALVTDSRSHASIEQPDYAKVFADSGGLLMKILRALIKTHPLLENRCGPLTNLSASVYRLGQQHPINAATWVDKNIRLFPEAQETLPEDDQQTQGLRSLISEFGYLLEPWVQIFTSSFPLYKEIIQQYCAHQYKYQGDPFALCKAKQLIDPACTLPRRMEPSAPPPKPTALQLRITEALAPISAEFTLTTEELDLLARVIGCSQLTPNVSLFDLLFFSLHAGISVQEQLVKKEAVQSILDSFEICYATLVTEAAKDTTALREFLDTLMDNLLSANAAPPEDQKQTAANEKMISQDLPKHVKIFKKFIDSPGCYDLLFHQPLSIFTGNSTPRPPTIQSIYEGTFESNGVLLLKILQALEKAYPSLDGSCESLRDLSVLVHFLGKKSQQEAAEWVKYMLLAWNPSAASTAVLEPKQLSLNISNFIKTMIHGLLPGTCPLPASQESPPADNEHLSNLLQQGEALSSLIQESGHLLHHWIQILLSSLPIYLSIIEQRPTLQHLQQRAKPRHDPNDLLAQFREKHVINPSFSLTEEEEVLIRELLDYPLTDNITVFDRLGLGIYSKLEQMKGLRPSLMKTITPIQKQISSYFVRLLLWVQRSKASDFLGPPNVHSEEFAYNPDHFFKCLGARLKELGDLINSLKPQNNSNKQIAETAATRRELSNAFNAINSMGTLLFHILNRSGSADLLFQAVTCYQQLDATNKPSPDTRAIIRLFWDYNKSGNSCFQGISCDFDSGIQSLWAFSNSPTRTEFLKFGSKIVKQIVLYQKEAANLLGAIKKIQSGESTYVIWEAGHRVLKDPTIGNKRPLDRIVALYCLRQQHIEFLVDFLQLVEERLLPDSNSFSIHRCMLCVYKWLRALEEHASSAPPASPEELANKIEPPAIPESSVKKIKTLAIRMLADLRPHLGPLSELMSSEAIKSESLVHSDWIERLIGMEPNISPALKTATARLLTLKTELVKDFRKMIFSLSADQLKAFDVQLFRKEIAFQSFPLLRLFLLCNSIQMILLKKYFVEVAEMIPEELLTILRFEELNTILQEKIQKLSPQDLPFPPRLPALTTSRGRGAKTRGTSRGQTRSLDKGAPLSPEAKALAQLTKSREIVDELKNWGLFPDHLTGSHITLKTETGAAVRVPNSNNIPLGTRRNIAKQASAASSNPDSPK